MRIFTAALAHETNSFSPIPTTRKSFEDGLLLRPGDRRHNRSLPFMGLDAFDRKAHEGGHELVRSTIAFAQPSAPTVRADYEGMRDEILADLEAGGAFDMVLLGLHGAMMAEGYPDCEGDIIKCVRDCVGPKVPIGVLLDLHCNVTDLMLDNATLIVACREYPHTDFSERGAELFGHLEDVVLGRTNPLTVQVRVPMLGMFHTPREPMRTLVDDARAFERDNNVVQVTLAHGFSWADFEGCSASVLVTSDGDEQKAQRVAQELAARFFKLRGKGTEPMLTVDEALYAVEAVSEGTVVLSDGSDNAGGGAASDSTFLLKACLERGMQGVAIGLLWDPGAVETAFLAGEGATLEMRIGGKAGKESGDPVDLTAKVKKLTTDKRHQLFTENQMTRLGRTALIEADGIEIVLNDLRQQPMHPSAFTEAGCDPWSKRLVIVKSAQHFYAGFAEQAAQILYCDAGGSLTMDATTRPYKHIRRPMWPLDDISFNQDDIS